MRYRVTVTGFQQEDLALMVADHFDPNGKAAEAGLTVKVEREDFRSTEEHSRVAVWREVKRPPLHREGKPFPGPVDPVDDATGQGRR